jgi:catechol 2,3-dioxygenase-like lactoylglutathione lyase family enzyme
MTGRPRLQSSTPLLVVADLPRALAFYAHLGFGGASVWGEPPCFAMVYRDGFELMLSRAEQAAHVRPNGGVGAWDVYLRIGDLAAELAALAAAGVTPDRGPTDTFYEMREVELLDPDGHRICIAQDITASAAGAAETWHGVLDVGAARLRLVLKLVPRGERCSATVDSPDQGAFDLPVSAVERTATSLRLELAAIGASFQGEVSADGTAIAGQWSQRGRAWPLVWRR